MNLTKEILFYRVPLDSHPITTMEEITSSPSERIEISNLQIFRCEHCDMDALVAKKIQRVFSSCKNLISIYLKSCMLIDTECTAYLAQGLCSNKSLRYLNLHWSNLNDDKAAQIITSLKDHPTIQEIDLSGNLCRLQGMNAIASLMRKSKTLKTLRLREQCIEEEKLDIRPLIEALLVSKTLQELDLSVNKLDDEDMEGLSNALNVPDAPLLISDVRSNTITDNGIIALTQQQSKLQKLWLQDNPKITHVGARVMRDYVKENYSLEYVGFAQEFDFFGEEIEYYTSLNWGGRRLLYNNNYYLNPALWPLILERAGNHGSGMAMDILHCLLPAILMTSSTARR